MHRVYSVAVTEAFNGHGALQDAADRDQVSRLHVDNLQLLVWYQIL